MPTYTSPARAFSANHSWYQRTDEPSDVIHETRFTNYVTLGTNTRTTNSDPSWKIKVAKKQNATNGYIRKEYSEIVSYLARASTLTVTPNYTIRGQGRYISFGNAYLGRYQSEDGELRDLALRRIKTKLQSHYGDKNVVLPVIELKDLRQTILGIARAGTDLLNQLIKIRKTRGASAIRYASDAWLTFNFGVSPLVNDVQDIARSIQDFLNRRDHAVRLTGTAARSWLSRERRVGDGPVAFGTTITTYSYLQHYLSYRYIGAFDVLVSSGNNYGAMDHFHLGFEDLLPTFWELIPYSWIVDYFTTVGAFFEDTFVVPAGNTKYLLLDRVYKLNAVERPQLVPPAGTIVTSQETRPGFINYYEFSRTPLTNLPRIGLHFKSLDSVGNHAIEKLLNLAGVFISGRKHGGI